jgi:hypothetical protein
MTAAPLAAIGARLWQRATAEERLLFACLHQHFDDAARQRLTTCAAAVTQWDEVLRVAVRHQVAPLVLHALGQARVLDAVPAPTRAGLHHEMLRNVAAKATMRTALVDATAWFAAQGADVMPVKGTSLDLRLRDAALTVSGDVDLLLRQDWSAFPASVHRRVAELNAGKPVLDVDFARHPDLVMNGLLPIDFAAIWARATRTILDGAPLFTMCAEHELLCACINSARKRYFRLKSLYEIAELLRLHPHLDWDEIARCARAWRCGRIVYAALTATSATTGVAVPHTLAHHVGVSRPVAALLSRLIARMSCTRLATLHGGVRIAGRRVGWPLLLVYASLGLRGLGASATNALRARCTAR